MKVTFIFLFFSVCVCVATAICKFSSRCHSSGSAQVWCVRRGVRWLLLGQRPLLCLGWR